MDELFRHENQGTSIALSDMGDLRHDTMSELMSCVESLITVPQKYMPDLDAKIVDGSMVVNMLSPKASSTLSDYAADVYLPYLIKLLQTSALVDVVWGRYILGSLKSSTRENKVRVVVSLLKAQHRPQRIGTVSFGWMRTRQSCTTTCQTAYQSNIHLGKGIDVIANSDSKIETDVYPCNHEEADTRLILHAFHCTRHGNRRILIRSVNTDVVVLWIATFHDLSIGERARFINWFFRPCILPKKVKNHLQSYKLCFLLFEHLCVSDI